jgi:hypothetical protein
MVLVMCIPMYMMNLTLKKQTKRKKYQNSTNLLTCKDHIVHFLPSDLEYLTDIKKISFNKKNLKTTYLLDIISNLLLKYYFKKENLFALNAQVLKSKYGFYYNYYIDYLVQEGYITKVLNHKSGITSRMYCLNESLLVNKIKRHKTFDKILVKKFINNFNNLLNKEDNTELNELHKKLIEDLFKVSIEYDNSILYLNSIISDRDIYNRNIYSIDSIYNKHIFYHFDNYGRLHTNFTILKSFVRKNFLKINSEDIVEFDIANSQPLFLAKLIYDQKSKWVNKEELDLFIYLTTNGKYYQYLMNNSNEKNKKIIKEITYKVFFGRNHHNSKYDKFFKSLFPTIHNFIKIYKQTKNDYKSLSHELQRMESQFVFNVVIQKIYNLNENIPIITIHDSIITNISNKDIVKTIFETEKINYFKFE